ncbi:unnamed protein product [Symbiodinium natans]|uniref:Uncharacterized protein n=1 Tax=Symbiodinium natans TaxID=878477 RepID=A0A812RCA9_9DINO|nr:unnamed protein product [Symbiodinium natans]
MSIVCKNLEHLLDGTRAAEESVWLAAHHVLLNYDRGSFPAVQNRISECMLDLLGEVLKDLPREAAQPSRMLWRAKDRSGLPCWWKLCRACKPLQRPSARACLEICCSSGGGVLVL